VTDYFDPVTGDVKHPVDLGPDAAAALAGFDVLIKNAKAGDGQTDTIYKFRLWDKVRAIELYMKHYGMPQGEVGPVWLSLVVRVRRVEVPLSL
jgi:hypothetical protein